MVQLLIEKLICNYFYDDQVAPLVKKYQKLTDSVSCFLNVFWFSC